MYTRGYLYLKLATTNTESWCVIHNIALKMSFSPPLLSSQKVQHSILYGYIDAKAIQTYAAQLADKNNEKQLFAKNPPSEFEVQLFSSSPNHIWWYLQSRVPAAWLKSVKFLTFLKLKRQSSTTSNNLHLVTKQHLTRSNSLYNLCTKNKLGAHFTNQFLCWFLNNLISSAR